MPLDQAVYVPTTGKIIGVMGPYVAKFNAATGAREAIQKVMGPAQGPCCLCYHAATGLVYVAVWNSQIGQYNDTNTPNPLRDIYPVDPSTLAIGTRLGVYEAVLNFDYTPVFYELFHFLLSVGNTLWITVSPYGSYLARVDPTNVAAFIPGLFLSPRDMGSFMSSLAWEQIATDGVGIYFCRPHAQELASYVPLASVNCDVTDSVSIDVADAGVIMPYSTEYCGGADRIYHACGDRWLVHANLLTHSYTKFNLDALISAGCNPYKLRYCTAAGNPFNGKLLLPSQGNDRVIVWNPATNTGIGRTGFDGPIDVVFTPTKAFAVQSGLVSLKEIVP